MTPKALFSDTWHPFVLEHSKWISSRFHVAMIPKNLTNNQAPSNINNLGMANDQGQSSRTKGKPT
jgi:hypothetical protein